MNKNNDIDMQPITNVSYSIETPSLLSEEDKERISSYAQQWKNAKSKTGSGSCIGLPELVPGRLMKIENLGIQTGALKAYISSVKHSFNANGFTTEFELGGD